MARTAESDRICQECWDRATYAHGTGEIFHARTRRFRGNLRALAFVGIAVPLAVGGVVLTFGTDSLDWKVLSFAGSLGLAQLILSAWSIVYGWADSLEYSLESASDNFALAASLQELGRTAPDPPLDIEQRFAVLKTRDDLRRNGDARVGVSAKELRFGHRAGLRQFRRPCDGCKEVPRSMEPTNCNICGRF